MCFEMTDMSVKCWAGRQAGLGRGKVWSNTASHYLCIVTGKIDVQVSGRVCWAENHWISIAHATSFPIMLWIAGNEFVVSGSRGMG